MTDTTQILVEPDETATQIRTYCSGREELADEYEPVDGEPLLRVLCYPLAEAYYFAQDKPDRLTAERKSHDGGTHWYLRRDDGAVIDLSLSPEKSYDPAWFDDGQPCGFLSLPHPSNRTQQILDALGVAYP